MSKFLKVISGKICMDVSLKRSRIGNDYDFIPDWDNALYKDIYTIFNENNVPLEYQKIYFELLVFPFKEFYRSSEVITGVVADFNIDTIPDNNNISIYTYDEINKGVSVIKRPIKFIASKKKISKKEVILFLTDLKNSGYLENYLESLKQIYGNLYKSKFIDMFIDDRINYIEKKRTIR